MPKAQKPDIVAVNTRNLEDVGFFCYMSKRRTAGYQRKLGWLKARLEEGMRIKMVTQGGRGFIEYLPGEHAWRPVNAAGYMFIHCIWVVGKSKGTGLSTLLFNECFKDAEEQGMSGVAMVSSEGNWLAGKDFLLRHGFQSVDHAPPSFELMAKKFRATPSPSFTGDWAGKMERLGEGLTIVRTNQCPYIEASERVMLEAAKELGIESKVVELRSPAEVRELAPSAYGVFSAVYDGALLSYHPLGRDSFLTRLYDLRSSQRGATVA